jgi:serine/threonine-protein kinase
MTPDLTSANATVAASDSLTSGGTAPTSPAIPSGNPFLSVAEPREARLVWEPGTRLGRFALGPWLGRGALGDVYRAQDTITSQEVAVKIVALGGRAAAARAERLQAEKHAYDRIQDHRHVLKVHDVHTAHWGGTELRLLSMEFADGGTLRTWLRAHRDDLPTRSAAGPRIFRELCRGVAASHRVGLVHLV